MSVRDDWEKLSTRALTAEAQVQELCDKLAAQNEVVRSQSERVSDYSNQVRILKDALSYYAGMPMHTSRGEHEYDSGSFEEDRGKRARRTLAELKARQDADPTAAELDALGGWKPAAQTNQVEQPDMLVKCENCYDARGYHQHWNKPSPCNECVCKDFVAPTRDDEGTFTDGRPHPDRGAIMQVTSTARSVERGTPCSPCPQETWCGAKGRSHCVHIHFAPGACVAKEESKKDG